MKFVNGLTALLVCQLLGEVLVRFLHWPVPGPVVGMLGLLLYLLARGRATAALDEAAGTLLSHLSLLFVPAGVGVMVHFHRIAAEWLPIVLSLVLGTLLTLAGTALVMRVVAGFVTAPEGEDA